MDTVSDVLAQKKFEKHTNVTQEFQTYGYQLAETLEDLAHKSLYIKLAKEVPREILEKAKSYTMDYPEARSKAKIFILKLKDHRKQKLA